MLKNNMINEKKKYGLASAIRRIITRLLDYLIISIISIGVFLGLTIWIVLNKNNNYNNTLFSGMFFLGIFLSFCIFFIYFIIIPWRWKGYTIFKKIFKIKTHDLINHKKFFYHLIKKETMLWIIIFIILFIFGIVLFFKNNPLQILNDLILFQFSTNDNKEILLPIFQFLFILSFIPNIIILIHMSVNSKKRAIHDFFSDTCVVYLIPISNNDDRSNLLLNTKIYDVDLPGIVDENSLKELND